MGLPASSPACHPVERLWEDRQRQLAVRDGQGRSSLQALQEQVAGLGQRYPAELSASLTGSAYLVEAA
jgi:hypothetical protein